jgi:hypothetical protein
MITQIAIVWIFFHDGFIPKQAGAMGAPLHFVICNVFWD